MALHAQETTKDRILRTGAEVIHLKGFNHTGLQEILSAAKVPKGSFYNYFKSKEDFGLQVVDYLIGQFSQFSKDMLGDTSIPPLERIRKMLDWFKDLFRSTEYTCGCPIGNLAQEMGDLSPAFRERLEVAMDAMADAYARILTEAQAAGEISKNLDPRETALFIVSSWHGALIRMKIVKSLEPLDNHSKFIIDHVLRS
jgi:TetR/AcrR family transcriptional repressor of nem operon